MKIKTLKNKPVVEKFKAVELTAPVTVDDVEYVPGDYMLIDENGVNVYRTKEQVAEQYVEVSR